MFKMHPTGIFYVIYSWEGLDNGNRSQDQQLNNIPSFTPLDRNNNLSCVWGSVYVNCTVLYHMIVHANLPQSQMLKNNSKEL